MNNTEAASLLGSGAASHQVRRAAAEQSTRGDSRARLDAYQSNALAANFAPGEPFTVTLSYTDADLAGKNENLLGLYHWAGGQWSDAGASCTVNAAQNALTCVLTSLAGKAALVEVHDAGKPAGVTRYR